MDIQMDYLEAASSALSYENVSFCKAEDSGYNTFTPSSIDCAEISRECLEPIRQNLSDKIKDQLKLHYYHVTPEMNIHLNRRYSHSTAFNDSLLDTPPMRRGLKRPYSSTDNADSHNSSIPTPTSFIAGKIQSLNVNENKENIVSPSPLSSLYAENFINKCYMRHDFDQILSYPTTPVKKNCKRSPCRRSGKKSNFMIHSLSCETHGLQSSQNPRVPSKAVRTILFLPEQKIDIISKLYNEAHALPPVMKIFNYLNNEDIHKFCSVSKDWLKIWDSVSENNYKKKGYKNFLKSAKENRENIDKGVTPKLNNVKATRALKEINNEIKEIGPALVPSPPGTPRTNRFKKFTKSASLDSRIQLACARCNQPAKVTEETSGEVWVECISFACLYQFCKYCKCDRHPGKSCFQYDLNGPSPSKRKKNLYAVGTKKSKRNLRRLL